MPRRINLSKQFHFFVRATALIFLWRGAWHLADIYLFPLNQVLSSTTSIVIGAVLIILADTLLWPREEETKASPSDPVCAPQE